MRPLTDGLGREGHGLLVGYSEQLLRAWGEMGAHTVLGIAPTWWPCPVCDRDALDKEEQVIQGISL